ncbi:MAG: hypothetical protein IIV13_02330 [Bacteroidaceae bacterium]|nr:hypothetical protein [Bacteroidaceae bacterium]
MDNRTFYTAVGNLRRKTEGFGQAYPVIVVNRQEYAMDIQEMTVWTALCWRLLDFKQLENKYEMLAKSSPTPTRTLESCVERLKTRGLIASGSGATDFDALYDLLSGLYVVPLSESMPLRLATFLKLVLLKGTPYNKAKVLFEKDNPNDREAQVMALSRQALLSTAELIKCVEVGATDISTDCKLLNALYADTDTTCDNIRYMMQDVLSQAPVTMAVANLYLRKQIIFERV